MRLDESSSSLGKRIRSGFQVRPVYLIASATVFHLFFTLTIYLIGRLKLLPGIFDADGTGIYFATDSFVYRAKAISMSGILTREGILAWLATPAQFHDRIYSLSFAAFGPLLGFNVLSAEPVNLLCYLLILILIFKLGQEVFDRRVGLVAAVAVALWPSLLLHTTQLLKDPMFIAGTLALVLLSVRWLTRHYSWRGAIAAGIASGITASLLWTIRISMWGVVPVIILLATFLFIIRLVRVEGAMMYGNLLGVVMALVLVAAIPFFVPRPVSYKNQLNGASTVEHQDVPADVGETELASTPREEKPKGWKNLGARVGYTREGFKRRYPEAGSNIDTETQFKSLGDVIRYLPRALSIGLFAPFPRMWFTSGEQVGLYGRLLSGVETLTMYVTEALALVGLWHSRRRLSVWLLLFITLVCVTMLGLVVLNVAALYRMRYVFWMLLILLGARGAIELIARLDQEPRVSTACLSRAGVQC